jgi:hypothetical protein
MHKSNSSILTFIKRVPINSAKTTESGLHIRHLAVNAVFMCFYNIFQAKGETRWQG